MPKNKWGLPDEEVTCPGCGQLYGHHYTTVDRNSQECSVCSKDYKRRDLVTAEQFIAEIHGTH